MVRYADDFVMLCRSEAEAKAARARGQTWVTANGLARHPEKTHIVIATQPGGFDFLGHHFERGFKWRHRKALAKIEDKVRRLTPRTSGESMEATITKLNDTLRGWFGYFKHSYRITLPTRDSYVRGRPRLILRKRAGKRGRGRGMITTDGATTTSTSWVCSASDLLIPRDQEV